MISAGFTINPLQADYIITKTGDKGKSSWRYGNVETVINILNENIDKFDLIKEFSLPDDSKALVYKRK